MTQFLDIYFAPFYQSLYLAIGQSFTNLMAGNGNPRRSIGYQHQANSTSLFRRPTQKATNLGNPKIAGKGEHSVTRLQKASLRQMSQHRIYSFYLTHDLKSFITFLISVKCWRWQTSSSFLTENHPSLHGTHILLFDLVQSYTNSLLQFSSFSIFPEAICSSPIWIHGNIFHPFARLFSLVECFPQNHRFQASWKRMLSWNPVSLKGNMF